MGKRLGLVVIGALLLTGCASAEPEAAPTVTVTATPEAAPIQAQAMETESAEDPESAFLAAVKTGWLGDVPADEELLTAGRYACEQYPTGLAYDQIIAVQGEDWQAADNNLKVTVNAGRYMCPEFNPENS